MAAEMDSAPMSFDDYDDNEEDATFPCQECGADVWVDAEVCSRCGTYVTDEDWGNHVESSQSSTPAWIKFTALVLVGLFILSAIVPLINSWSPPELPDAE